MHDDMIIQGAICQSKEETMKQMPKSSKELPLTLKLNLKVTIPLCAISIDTHEKLLKISNKSLFLVSSSPLKALATVLSCLMNTIHYSLPKDTLS